MIWGVYIEIYILWEFGYLIDSPLILYIYSTTDRKKRFTEFGVWITAFTDRNGYADGMALMTVDEKLALFFLCTFFIFV